MPRAFSCGMNVWLANSQVVHATSPDPRMTPFVKRGVVAPVFAHEPIARRAPTGEYVIWYTAVMGDWNPPVKGVLRALSPSSPLSLSSLSPPPSNLPRSLYPPL